MTQEELIHKELVYKIVGCAMKVHRELGYGFLEKVYENSMMVLLNKEIFLKIRLLVNILLML
jgi:GxxExxY protein